jgi:GTP-binding protein HflX
VVSTLEDDYPSETLVTPATPRSRDGQGPQTVLVARAADKDPDTTEIRALATVAGYDVVEAITQRRREDPTYGVGRGTAETVARRVTAIDADAVVYDGSLSPGQTFSLGDLLPDGVTVADRPRLVLGLIAAASDSRAAGLRFELAVRRYELPRLREVLGRDGHARRLRPEGAGRVRDLEQQIERLEDDLEACVSTVTGTNDDWRADATSNDADRGPSRVAVVGYANVGKSLLCQRLDAWTEGKPATTRTGDLAPTPGTELDTVTDQPLATVGTSTTTTSLAGRRLRLTDTTGIVAGLPTEAIGAFDRTRAAVREATITLLVIDASTDLSALERRLTAVVDVLDDHHHDVIPVVTHIDRLVSQCGVGESTAVTDTTDAAATESVTTESDTASFVASRTTAIAEELAGVGFDPPCDPIPLDAHSETGIDAVVSAVVDALPTTMETLTVAYGGDTQAALSWAYDRDLVTDVSYDEDGIDVTLAGRPESVAAAVHRFNR